MGNLKRYNLYKEENRYKGAVHIDYMAYAYDENDVRELAQENSIDIDGFTIEFDKNLPKTIFNKTVERKIFETEY